VKRLAIAWLASAFAFAAAMTAWMLTTAWLDGVPMPRPQGLLRSALLTLGIALVFQCLFGGLIYFALNRLHIWRLWSVTLAYLSMVVMISWQLSDTTNDVIGTGKWLVLALIVAVVFWFFASPARRVGTASPDQPQ
jgi:hypothetical protein